MDNLPPGTFAVGNKLMGKCQECGKLVHINKTFFGDLHVCLSEEEIKEKEKLKQKNRLNILEQV